jgi:large subunit ribosomal protein L15
MKFKHKKIRKMRGSKTHGWGAMKKHRGAGHRGGRGRSGSGKRADQKKPSYWKTERAGKHGFSTVNPRIINPINIKDLEQIIPGLVKKGLASQDGTTYTIDLARIHKNKLLGTGRVQHVLNITVDYASERAVEKITASRGRVTTKLKKEDTA